MGNQPIIVTVPILDRSRKYGYLFWQKRKDEEVYKLLGRRRVVDVVLDGQYIGQKKVVLKYRRISIGPGKARGIPRDATDFQHSFDKDGRLQIRCK